MNENYVDAVVDYTLTLCDEEVAEAAEVLRAAANRLGSGGTEDG